MYRKQERDALPRLQVVSNACVARRHILDGAIPTDQRPNPRRRRPRQPAFADDSATAPTGKDAPRRRQPPQDRARRAAGGCRRGRRLVRLRLVDGRPLHGLDR